MSQSYLEEQTDKYLADSVVAIKRQEVECSKALRNINKEIDRRWSERVRAKYSQLRKDGGAATISADGGLTVKSTICKKVVWDQGVLRALAVNVTKPDFDRYFTMKFSVSEKVYGEADASMRAALDAARTVKYGDPKITLEVEG